MFQMISMCPINPGGSICNCVFDGNHPTLIEFCKEISSGKLSDWGFVDVRLSSMPVKPVLRISYKSGVGFDPTDDHLLDYEVETANSSGNSDRTDYIVILEDI